MSLATLAVIFWAVVALVQISISVQFLERVKSENPEEYDRIDGDGQKGWLLIIPMTVGAAYGDAELHDIWGLSDSTKKLGRKLRLMTLFSYVALLGCGTAIVCQIL
jgi:hypothetical protein